MVNLTKQYFDNICDLVWNILHKEKCEDCLMLHLSKEWECLKIEELDNGNIRAELIKRCIVKKPFKLGC